MHVRLMLFDGNIVARKVGAESCFACNPSYHLIYYTMNRLKQSKVKSNAAAIHR